MAGHGSPARALLAAANGCAMLVVAAHCGPARWRRPFGGVTETCLREATVPVVVVPDVSEVSSLPDACGTR